MPPTPNDQAVLDLAADLAEASSYRQPSEDCDLIMKGGLASGVVYPRAACRLATGYRFRKLGGASVGAVAAAVTAAAEYRRQQGGPGCGEGFRALHALPTVLGSNLAALFQPAPRTRAGLAILMAALPDPGADPPASPTPHQAADPDRPATRPSRLRRTLQTLRKVLPPAGRATGTLVRVAPGAFGVSLAVASSPLLAWLAAAPGPVSSAEWRRLVWPTVLWLPGGVLAALLATAGWVGWRTAQGMAGNGFGLCVGHLPDGAGRGPEHPQALTDWLTDTVDAIAGRDRDGAPLTFGDLWGDQARATYDELRRREKEAERQPSGRVTAAHWRAFEPVVDLKVMTTDLTVRRPYEFPFSSHEFYYCPDCWADYFPRRVLQHLERTSTAPGTVGTSADREDHTTPLACPRAAAHRQPVRRLPSAPDLPVVVAARISLSFPGLVSAVPLIAVDWSRKREKRTPILHWFSDGGIASNFPMHFFDAPWPRRPTFGLNLETTHPDYPAMVYRPEVGVRGGSPRARVPESLVDFGAAILRTMQNWVDATQIGLPGFRDRITEVRLDPDGGEGGINLRMRRELIEKLASRGDEAGAEFAGFRRQEHEWIRYRTAMNALSDHLDVMQACWLPRPDHEGYRALTGRFRERDGLFRLSVADAPGDSRAAEDLMQLAGRWEGAGYPASAPRLPTPSPRLRQVPPL